VLVAITSRAKDLGVFNRVRATESYRHNVVMVPLRRFFVLANRLLAACALAALAIEKLAKLRVCYDAASKIDAVAASGESYFADFSPTLRIL
jgi:hypothetical protein